jgi:hypothetical protein
VIATVATARVPASSGIVGHLRQVDRTQKLAKNAAVMQRRPHPVGLQISCCQGLVSPEPNAAHY